MKHTVGYNASTSLPITIAYKCSKCGYLNIHKCELFTNSFGFTKESAKSDASYELKTKIRMIQEASNRELLKGLGIDGNCIRCRNHEKWACKENNSKWSELRIIIVLILTLLIALSCLGATLGPSLPSLPVHGQKTLCICAAVVFSIILLILILSSNKRKNTIDSPVSSESKPVIVYVGNDDIDKKEYKQLRQISMFMEQEKANFYRSIGKYKDTEKILKKCEAMSYYYSELFTNDLLLSIKALIQKEESNGVSQKELAISAIKEYLMNIEDTAPTTFLDSLHTQ